MSVPFIFKNEQIDVTKYEYVEILKATPKNPKDFNDTSNILRHRQTMLVKELYGNVRAGNPEAFSVEGNRVKTSGVWYLDGYRFAMTNVLSSNTLPTSPANGAVYNIYLKLRFEEITMQDDPSIGLQDPASDKLIQTSRRIKFGYEIELSSSTINTVPDGWDAIYFLATATYAAEWDFADSDDIAYVNLTYNEAIAIINKAVHTEDDLTTVKIKKLVTNTASNTAKMIMEESDERIKLAVENNQGNEIAAFEAVIEGGQLYPILWMTPDNDNYPISFVSPEGFKTFDNKGNLTEILNNKLSVGNSINGLKFDGNGFYLTLGNQTGFNISKQALHSGTSPVKSAVASISVADTDYQYGSPRTPNYEKWTRLKSSVLAAGESSKYSVVIPAANWPTEGVISVNHKIMYESGHRFGIVTAVADLGGVEITKQNYVIAPGSTVTVQPMEIFVGTNDELVDKTINITYTAAAFNTDGITNDIVCSVGLSNGVSPNSPNIQWNYYNYLSFLAEHDVIKIGNRLIWVDTSNRFKIKDITGSANLLAKDIYDFKNNAPGSTYNALGGKEVLPSAGLTNITIAELEAPELPLYPRDYPEWDAQNETLSFPSAEEDGVRGGLISNTAVKDMRNNILQAKKLALQALAKTPGMIMPSSTVFVSKNWEISDASINDTDAYPFFNKIQTAINYINSTMTDSKGTIVVYPGTYTENLNLSNLSVAGSSLSIVAMDPKNTVIKGLVTDGSNPVNAFINCPILSNTSHAINITNASSNITIGADAVVSANTGNVEYLILQTGGTLTVKGEILSSQLGYVVKPDAGTFILDSGKIDAVYGLIEQSSPLSTAKVILNNAYIKTSDTLRPSLIVTNNNLVARNSSIISAGTRSVDTAFDDTGVININVKMFGCYSNKGLSGTNGTVTNLISNGLTVDTDIE